MASTSCGSCSPSGFARSCRCGGPATQAGAPAVFQDGPARSSGAFNIVRNPIFSAMLVTAIGLALMVPNVIAAAGLIALVVALELQVRGAEEPYLLRVHGTPYADYVARVGRFAPNIGRR